MYLQSKLQSQLRSVKDTKAAAGRCRRVLACTVATGGIRCSLAEAPPLAQTLPSLIGVEAKSGLR